MLVMTVDLAAMLLVGSSALLPLFCFLDNVGLSAGIDHARAFILRRNTLFNATTLLPVMMLHVTRMVMRDMARMVMMSTLVTPHSSLLECCVLANTEQSGIETNIIGIDRLTNDQLIGASACSERANGTTNVTRSRCRHRLVANKI